MSRLIACLLGATCLIVPAEAQAAKGSLYSGPGPQPGPRSSTSSRRPHRSCETPGRGRPSRCWSPAPPPIAAASSSTRTSSTTTAAPAGDRATRAIRGPGRHLLAPRAAPTPTPPIPAYAENAADLVELRVKPLRRSTAFRITLNSLLDPALVGATIAIGESAEPLPLPHGAGVERAGGVLPHRPRRRGGAGRRPPAERRSSPRRGSGCPPGATRSTSGLPRAPGTRAPSGFGSPPASDSGTRPPTPT